MMYCITAHGQYQGEKAIFQWRRLDFESSAHHNYSVTETVIEGARLEVGTMRLSLTLDEALHNLCGPRDGVSGAAVVTITDALRAAAVAPLLPAERAKGIVRVHVALHFSIPLFARGCSGS